jgi:adenylate kinase
MIHHPHTFIFVGRSGSGKGTQADALQTFLKSKDSNPITYLQTGQRFREFIAENTFTSNLSKEMIQNGELMPEFLGVWVWSSIFVENMQGNEHLILDGMPRRLREAYILDSAMEFYKRDMPLVIHIDISKEVATERLMSRARQDDVPEEIQRRLAWFDTDVVPVLEFYERDRKYNYITVNGEQAIEKIAADIQHNIHTLYGYNN